MNLEAMDVMSYQQFMESLIFFTHVCLNIAYIVNVINRFMNNPQEVHLNATKNIIWYVKGAFEFGTFFLHENKCLLDRMGGCGLGMWPW